MLIRDLDTDADRAGILALDTSFETPTIYDIAISPLSIQLVLRTLPRPRIKRYPIADVFAHWAQWDTGWVAAESNRITGIACVEYESWHSRLTLWHLYVAADRRRAGIARALLARVESHGRSLGAHRVWLETSNINVPGIAAYAHLGYTLCGADTTLYDGLPYADESALYLSKPL